jgi:hypothetical protein
MLGTEQDRALIEPYELAEAGLILAGGNRTSASLRYEGPVRDAWRHWGHSHSQRQCHCCRLWMGSQVRTFCPFAIPVKKIFHPFRL